MPFLAPAFAAVSAFAATAIGQIVIGVAGSLAVSLLQGILMPPPSSTQSKPAIGGVQIDVQLGDTSPLSFPVGYSATAGARKYINSWGTDGDVPNAYLAEVRQLTDLPISGLNGIWVNGEKCTILWNAPVTERGYPVQQYRRNGKDYLWIKFFDGTQNAADPYLVNRFGNHPDYPWQSTAIGTGCAYAVVTSLWDREVWQGNSNIDLLFEPGSVRLYDLRKDSTNGGSGAHRWNNPATWEPSDNPVVILYNLVRGVYYGSEWVFGGRSVQSFQLPPASWIAAANECDVLMPLAGGGTERQFRAGFEVICDNEPLKVIEELLQACNGRLCEIGGIFEIMVGAPGAAIYSFTDEDIVISRNQNYTPSPGLNDTRNAITYAYPEPVEAWQSKDGPSRYYPEYEAEDGGRRLARGIEFNASPFGTQNQRLANALVKDDRRWRVHEFTLPPDAWILTGTSVVNWNSARNGYVNKKFLVSRANGEPGMLQPVVLRETDPSDWNWSSNFQLPSPTVTLTPIRPGPQTPTGFQAFPATFKDASGRDRRPSIQISYDGNMPDIQSVHVLVRLKASGAYVFEGFIPFEPPYSVVLNATFLPNEVYEVAIRYVPISARETLFTEYQEVTTPNVLLTDSDIFIDLSNVAKDVLGQLGTKPRQIIESFKRLGTLLEEADREHFIERQTLTREISVQLDGLEASFDEVIEVALGPGGAIAQALASLYAAMGSNNSQVNVRWEAVAAPSGYSARYAIQAAVNDGTFRQATFFLDVPANPSQPTRIGFMAGQTVFYTSDGTPIGLVDENGFLRSANDSVTINMINGDFSFGR